MLDRWIFDSFEATPRGLACYRIFFALFTLLFVAPGHDLYTDFAQLATLPDALFLPPPGPLALLDGFPPALFFEGVVLLLNLSLAALLFGYRTPSASVLVGVLFLVGYGFSYALGKINHNLLFVLVPLVMAGSGWGSAWSLDARAGRAPPRAQSWMLVLLALLVGFGMFTAGFSKLIGGWLDPATYATQGHLFRQYFLRGRQDLLAPLLVAFDSGVFWKTLDYGTLVFEMGFLAAAFHPRATRLFAALAVFFHLGTALVLNIAFVFNLAAYAAFLPWPRLARGVEARLSALGAPPAFWQRRGTLFAAWVGLGGLSYVAGSPLLVLDRADLLASDLTLKELVALGMAVAVVLALGLRQARSALARCTSAATAPS